MKSVALIVTGACRRACAYCYDTGGDDMSAEVASAAALLAPADGKARPLFGLIGGEPMERWKNTKRVMAAVRASCVDVGTPAFTMTTGGSLDAVATREAAALVSSFTVSVDGPLRVHDKQRGEGDHAAVVRFLTTLRASRGRVTRLRATLDPCVWGDDLPLLATVRHLVVLCGHKLAGGLAVEVATNRAVSGFDPTRAVTAAVDWYTRFRASGGPPLWHAVETVAKRLSGPLSFDVSPRCGAARSMVAVAPDGGIWPCHRRPGKKSIGNVLEGIDEEALSGWWDTILGSRAVCLSCEDWPICRGGCPAEDDFEGVSETACAWRRAIIGAVRRTTGAKRDTDSALLLNE
jgi:uncharacterized protein